jgi:hypothetical protein
MFLAYTFAWLLAAYLNVIIAIVMQVKHTVNFTIHIDVNIVDTLNTFTDRLTGILLHLNVVKFPAKEKKEENR